MLTAADLDLRPDPGSVVAHQLRVAWRQMPGLSAADFECMKLVAPQEDPDVAANCAGY